VNRQNADLKSEELGNSLIHEVISGNLPAVKKLVAAGADVNFANVNSFTPLMAAAQRKQLGILKFLLENGASPNPVENSTCRTALMHACMSGSPACVDILLSCGADVNERDTYGMSALMLAAVTGEIEMVQHLVNAGAKLDARTDDGFTARDWAIKFERRRVANYLLWTEGAKQ
jgi:uncharacterized protein